VSHQFIKANPHKCILCGFEKGGRMVREYGGVCEHDCEKYELQGNGDWIWCPKCKSYVDPEKETNDAREAIKQVPES
jgi:hypothetical protein